MKRNHRYTSLKMTKETTTHRSITSQQVHTCIYSCLTLYTNYSIMYECIYCIILVFLTPTNICYMRWWSHLGVLGETFLRVALNVTNRVMAENTIHTLIIRQNPALAEIYRGITHIPNKVIICKHQRIVHMINNMVYSHDTIFYAEVST